MVIPDSSVWIAYQRSPDSPVGQELDSLLAGREVVLVGPVLVEILQGSRSESEWAFLAQHLSALEFLDADIETWLQAGKLGFQLRRQGLTIAFADLVISSLAIQHGLPVFTIDQDFQSVPGLQLHSPPQ